MTMDEERDIGKNMHDVENIENPPSGFLIDMSTFYRLEAQVMGVEKKVNRIQSTL